MNIPITPEMALSIAQAYLLIKRKLAEERNQQAEDMTDADALLLLKNRAKRIVDTGEAWEDAHPEG